MPAKDQIVVRELAPREGFQSLKRVIDTQEKSRFIDLLSDTGVNEIEVTSFVNSTRVPQMADAEQVAAALSPKADVRYTALCLNEKGIARAKQFSVLELSGWLYTSLCPDFLSENYRDTPEGVLSKLLPRIEFFASQDVPFRGLMISAAFGSNWRGAFGLETFRDFISAYAELFAGRILPELSFADTMGWGEPSQVASFCKLAREFFPSTEFSLHLHDNRGLAISNALEGFEQGVRIFESSLAGVGGCPFVSGAAGNIATEDLLYALERRGVKTGFDFDAGAKAFEFLLSELELELRGKLYGNKRYF